jgi:hypothetical protein
MRAGQSRWIYLLVLGIICSFLLGSTGCGGGSTVPPLSVQNPTPTPTPTPTPGTTSTTAHDRVFLVVFENHSYSSVVGNTSMPYLNSLIGSFGLATNYFANAHPSLPNYFVLTTGQTLALTDDFPGPVSNDNAARALTTAGKSWRVYAQSLPATGYTGGDQGPYIKHHNPFAYFSDVLGSSAQANNMVPFSQFSADLNANTLPNYSFIVPDNSHNSHDCPSGGSNCNDNDKLHDADEFLRTNIAPLIASASFQKSGLLIITFDEADISDFSFGGGKVATVVISSKAKPGFQSTTFYQHQSVLRLMLKALGLTAFPGAASTAPEMDEFFK